MEVKKLDLEDVDIFAEQVANAVITDASETNNNGLLLESYLQILRSKILRKMEDFDTQGVNDENN